MELIKGLDVGKVKVNQFTANEMMVFEYKSTIRIHYI